MLDGTSIPFHNPTKHSRRLPAASIRLATSSAAVDPAGGHHSPNKKLTRPTPRGDPAAALATSTAQLPSVPSFKSSKSPRKASAIGMSRWRAILSKPCDYPKKEAFTGQATTLSATRAQAAE
jgi:hypothetical protein